MTFIFHLMQYFLLEHVDFVLLYDAFECSQQNTKNLKILPENKYLPSGSCSVPT